MHGRERRKGEKRKNKRNEEERATSVGFQETALKLSLNIAFSEKYTI